MSEVLPKRICPYPGCTKEATWGKGMACDTPGHEEAVNDDIADFNGGIPSI